MSRWGGLPDSRFNPPTYDPDARTVGDIMGGLGWLAVSLGLLAAGAWAGFAMVVDLAARFGWSL